MDDMQFKDKTIAEVRKESEGWSIKLSDGWSFHVPADSPIVPAEGMTARMYGKGIGHVVRGLFLDGIKVYYRTEAEDKEKQEIDLYGADVADILKRWDEGCSVWSIEMGGIGPGYEQAIQVLMIEILREAEKRGPQEWTDESFEAMRDEVVHIHDESLGGLSGAQVGAATHIAWKIIFDGPREFVRKIKEQRIDNRMIQISKDWPRAKALIRTQRSPSIEAK